MRTRSCAREVEDVPELMQNIQSRLPVKQAARTSVLSKSWLHAWSTIPTLRFNVRRGKSMKLVDIDHTLKRYLHDNTPIERFALTIDIDNQESASLAEKWIGPVATKTRLKEFILSIDLLGASFTLPDEMLSGENLTKISVSSTTGIHSVWMATSQHPVINCVSLRELHLSGVRVSEEVLHDILSSCNLLVKIELLYSCEGFKAIKVKNLLRLYELRIALDAVHSTALEISGVPNLGVFSCNIRSREWMNSHLFNSHSISLGSNVTELTLGGVILDNERMDMIKSGFPFLESLTLHMTCWMSGSFHFTCGSMKRLSLLLCPLILTDIQVNAPNLLFFRFGGRTLPSLLFPVSSLKQTTVSLSQHLPVDADFFLKMREALMLSRIFYLHITTDISMLPLDIDIDDLKTRLRFPPATNVQELSFGTSGDECLWERSPFFDAFFEICHPKCVFAKPDTWLRQNNHFSRLMLREVLEKKTMRTGTAYWPNQLKHVQIKQSLHKIWETLTNSKRSFLDGSGPAVCLEFKLEWC